MKKVISIIMAVVFLIVLICITASAAESVVEISTEEQLISFVENGGKGILQDNITIKNELNVYSNISLDLNSYVISADDTVGFASIVFRNDTKVILYDNTDTGGIFDDKDLINIVIEDQVDFTIKSGYYADVTAWGGYINLLGGKISKFTFDEVWPLEIYIENTEIDFYNFGRAIINEIPNQELPLGFKKVKTDDGKYKIEFSQIKKKGETFTVYFDAFVSRTGKYQLTVDGTAPKKVFLKILYVNNGKAEIIPMECTDDRGKLWKCEFDKAYIGAEIVFCADEESSLSSYVTNLPNKNKMTYNAEKLWYNTPPNLTIYIIIGAVAEVLIIIAIFMLFFVNKNNSKN